VSYPRYPKVNDYWGKCGTCGFDVPVRFLTLTRKHGWQCLPGSPTTRGCFDGNYDRDDIQFAYPAGEGARETSAPLTQILTEGVGPDYTNTFWMRDLITGAIWQVTIDPIALTIVLVPSTLQAALGTILNGVSIASAQEFSLIIVNGAPMLTTTVSDFTSPPTSIINVTPPNGGIVGPPGGPGTIIPPFPPNIPPPPMLTCPGGITSETWEWLYQDCLTIPPVTEPWEN
jgi:hypothetical protein